MTSSRLAALFGRPLSTAGVRRGVAALALLALAGAAGAAPIVWNDGQAISGDSDVNTSGTLVGAVNINGATTTVNGVTFQRFGVSSGTSVLGGFSFTADALGGTDTSYTSGPYTALSSAYQQLVGTGTRTIRTDTLVLTGLSVGTSYLFQLWANDSAESFDGGYGLEASDGQGNSQMVGSGWQGALGSTLTGTFVADAGTQTVVLAASEVGVINGFQLRARTVTVPEPGSLALVACALAALGLGRRRAG